MGGCLRRKARGFPHIRRQSRFLRDFDATLLAAGHSPLSTSGAVQRTKRACPTHFAGSIAVTLIVSPLSVPVIFTFCPANCSGFFWSES